MRFDYFKMNPTSRLTDTKSNNEEDVALLLGSLAITGKEKRVIAALMKTNGVTLKKISEATGINLGNASNAVSALASKGIVSKEKVFNEQTNRYDVKIVLGDIKEITSEAKKKEEEKKIVYLSDLNNSEKKVFEFLKNNPEKSKTRQIAEDLSMARENVNKYLILLQSKGFISREKSSEDGSFYSKIRKNTEVLDKRPNLEEIENREAFALAIARGAQSRVDVYRKTSLSRRSVESFFNEFNEREIIDTKFNVVDPAKLFELAERAIEKMTEEKRLSMKEKDKTEAESKKKIEQELSEISEKAKSGAFWTSSAIVKEISTNDQSAKREILTNALAGIFVDIKYLAKSFHEDEAELEKWLNALEESGLIELDQRGTKFRTIEDANVKVCEELALAMTTAKSLEETIATKEKIAATLNLRRDYEEKVNRFLNSINDRLLENYKKTKSPFLHLKSIAQLVLPDKDKLSTESVFKKTNKEAFIEDSVKRLFEFGFLRIHKEYFEESLEDGLHPSKYSPIIEYSPLGEFGEGFFNMYLSKAKYENFRQTRYLEAIDKACENDLGIESMSISAIAKENNFDEEDLRKFCEESSRVSWAVDINEQGRFERYVFKKEDGIEKATPFDEFEYLKTGKIEKESRLTNALVKQGLSPQEARERLRTISKTGAYKVCRSKFKTEKQSDYFYRFDHDGYERDIHEDMRNIRAITLSNGEYQFGTFEERLTEDGFRSKINEETSMAISGKVDGFPAKTIRFLIEEKVNRRSTIRQMIRDELGISDEESEKKIQYLVRQGIFGKFQTKAKGMDYLIGCQSQSPDWTLITGRFGGGNFPDTLVRDFSKEEIIKIMEENGYALSWREWANTNQVSQTENNRNLHFYENLQEHSEASRFVHGLGNLALIPRNRLLQMAGGSPLKTLVLSKIFAPYEENPEFYRACETDPERLTSVLQSLEKGSWFEKKRPYIDASKEVFAIEAAKTFDLEDEEVDPSKLLKLTKTMKSGFTLG